MGKILPDDEIRRIKAFTEAWHKDDTDKELVIAICLESDEGRMALAQAMVEPIRRNLNYASIGSKILMI